MNRSDNYNRSTWACVQLLIIIPVGCMLSTCTLWNVLDPHNPSFSPVVVCGDCSVVSVIVALRLAVVVFA